MKIKNLLLIGIIILLSISCENKKKVEQEKVQEEKVQDLIPLTEKQLKIVNIGIGKIEKKNLNSVIRVNGVLALDPQNKAEITSLVAGVIKKVLVIEGSKVRRGQVLAYLENTDIVEIQKNYITLKKEENIKEQEYLRQKELYKQEAGIEKTLQQAKAAYEITKTQVLGIEKQLQQLSINYYQISLGKVFTQIPIKSPINGVVDKINVSLGSYVDMKTSLMNVVDNSNLHCDLKVFEKDIQYVKAGQNIEIEITNQKNIKLQGKIYEVTSSFENDTKAILVHAKIKKNTNVKLIPDMYVTGLINVGKQTVDAVSNDAIISKDGKQMIFQLAKKENNNNIKTYYFKPIEVITGVSELGYTQISFIKDIPYNIDIVTHNAFYLSSMIADDK